MELAGQLYQLRGPSGEVLREVEVLGAGGASFTHQKDLIHGPDGLIATISRGGETFYFHQDHLGTPRSATDSAGVWKGKHDYYPFGQETPNHPQHPDLTVKWTGHQRDLHGFSDYMMGRTCLYPLLRFASVDPARDGWNLYAYGRNNPIRYTDPTGLFSKEQGASVAVSFVPVIGDLKDFQEVVTGQDLITGERLSDTERALTVAAAVLPIVSGVGCERLQGLWQRVAMFLLRLEETTRSSCFGLPPMLRLRT